MSWLRQGYTDIKRRATDLESGVPDNGSQLHQYTLWILGKRKLCVHKFYVNYTLPGMETAS